MFDWSLHWRFWQSATTAALEATTAALAANAEMNQRWIDQSPLGQSPKAVEFPAAALSSPSPFDAAMWPWQAWQWADQLPTLTTMHTGFSPSAFAPFTTWANPAAPAPETTPADPWLAAMKTFWSYPAMPWATYRTPVMTWLMCFGVPSSIAVPAARASASAADAAEAARQQALAMISTLESFSAYRSDGGHASAQIITWPTADDVAARAKRR